MSHLRLTAILATAVLAVGISGTASAVTFLHAELTNDAEPSVTLTDGTNPRPASFGSADFVLSDDMTSMTMIATIFNIDVTGSQTPFTQDNLSAAHIHANATVTGTQTAGVVWGFFGAPFNDNNPNDAGVIPFAPGLVGGTFTGKWDAPEGNGTTLAAQLNNILTGHAYVNFHTSQNPGGEIRGYLVVVPEPASLSLLTLPALAMLRRRSRR